MIISRNNVTVSLDRSVGMCMCVGVCVCVSVGVAMGLFVSLCQILLIYLILLMAWLFSALNFFLDTHVLAGSFLLRWRDLVHGDLVQGDLVRGILARGSFPIMSGGIFPP